MKHPSEGNSGIDVLDRNHIFFFNKWVCKKKLKDATRLFSFSNFTLGFHVIHQKMLKIIQYISELVRGRISKMGFLKTRTLSLEASLFEQIFV